MPRTAYIHAQSPSRYIFKIVVVISGFSPVVQFASMLKSSFLSLRRGRVCVVRAHFVLFTLALHHDSRGSVAPAHLSEHLFIVSLCFCINVRATTWFDRNT